MTTLDTGSVATSLGYAGGLADPATGLVRFGARDYDPETGRWTAKDPIGLAGGTNVYAYAANRPERLVDPEGLLSSEDLEMRVENGMGGLGSGAARAAAKVAINPVRLLVLRKQANDASQRVHPQVAGAYRHAMAAYLISCEYGPHVAFNLGVLQELLIPGPPSDTDIDFMNNWQGLNYGMNPEELLRSGLLFDGNGQRHARGMASYAPQPR